MAELVLKVVNGWAVYAASIKSAAGASRFHIEFPAYLSEDVGARHLIGTDSQAGYELPTRNLLERVLRPGDLFVDVGAHWGFFTLQAATHPAGAIRAIAFEPDPTNAAILFRNIVANGLTESAHLVCAACGDRCELAPLISNTTMAHSIRGVGLKPPFGRGPAKWVPVFTLDSALSAFPHAAVGRVILKVDVEGFEPQVIAGASGLLESGRVAVIIWERGQAFGDGAERERMVDMVATLSRRGFQHWRLVHPHADGSLTPFHAGDDYVGNVLSVGSTVLFDQIARASYSP